MADGCCASEGTKAVAVASYECKAESMFCEETMTTRAALHETLVPKIKGVTEISNGYAMDFPSCSATLVEVAEMVAMSRECCDFIDYKIVADSKGGAVHLVMTGDAGAKAFLAKALGPMVTQVADTSMDCCSAEGATAVAASDAACAGACEDKVMAKANKNTGNAIVTRISINDACCESGVKAVKAGNMMPKCCTENAAKGAELE